MPPLPLNTRLWVFEKAPLYLRHPYSYLETAVFRRMVVFTSLWETLGKLHKSDIYPMVAPFSRFRRNVWSAPFPFLLDIRPSPGGNIAVFNDRISFFSDKLDRSPASFRTHLSRNFLVTH